MWFQHLIIAGGYDGSTLDSSEVYSYRDNVWTEGGKMPDRMYGVRAVTVNNRVLLFGMINLYPFNF